MAAHRAPAVTRAIAVLKLLALERDGLGVNAIARQLDIVPSSCLHVLRALAADGLVQVDPDSKRYSLGLGLLTLAHEMLGRNHFARLVQPCLVQIAHNYAATATAVELDDRERMVVVAVAQAPTMLQIQVGIGSRFPAWISATGRCIAAAAGLSPDALRRRFATLKWQSPPCFEQWLREIERARHDGFAVDVGNYICGFTIVAAPVETTGEVRRAVSVVNVSEQLSDVQLAKLARDTKDAAHRVGLCLRGLR